jgi:hypothetical protein
MGERAVLPLDRAYPVDIARFLGTTENGARTQNRRRPDRVSATAPGQTSQQTVTTFVRLIRANRMRKRSARSSN